MNTTSITRSARMPVHFVPCRIARGGFSSERTFFIDVEGEERVLCGTAHLDYLRDADRQPIGDEQPLPGEEISGFVQCREIESADGRVVVEVPSTDLLEMPRDNLVAID
jgi:hypothetical protein